MYVPKRAWLLAIGLAAVEAMADVACPAEHCAVRGPQHGSWCPKRTVCNSGYNMSYQEPGAGVGNLDWIGVSVVAMYSPGKDVPAAAVLPNSKHHRRNVNPTYLFPIAGGKVVYRR